ncbi:MAG: dihydroorotase, partial [Bacteroidetes bacterium]|nr:dihydroorotase [Bacteroidota bacterium]
NGVISKIAKSIIDTDAVLIEGKGLGASIGWADMRVNFADPGFEFKEDIDSGCEAAAFGGITTVGLMPETQPLVTTKSQVEYILNRSRDKVVNVLPFGRIANKDGCLTEMVDMLNSGALSFTSGYKSISDEGFLLRAMLYAKSLNIRLAFFAENCGIAGIGVVNEGLVNVQLGLKGSPAFAEEVEVQKIISIAKYNGTPVHLSGISTKRAVELIAEAKRKGLDITAEVYINHLMFDESHIANFDTNLKLRPPLRTAEDKAALIDALERGIIDIVSSDHSPHEEDAKHCEFDLASYGAIGTQTLFSQLIAVYGVQKIAFISNLLSARPRKVFGVEVPTIKEGNNAEITVFSATEKWTLNSKTNKSKAINTPLWGKELQGKAVALINKNQVKVLA